MQPNVKFSVFPWIRRAALAGLLSFLAGPASAADMELADRIAAIDPSHPLVPVIQMASKCLEQLQAVGDYEAHMVKREMVNGNMLTAQMEMKLREEPKSVYLKFIQPHDGREVIYEEGKNDGNMLVHETGIAALVGVLSINPNSDLVMSENRYAISNIGLRNLMGFLIERWIQETELDGVDVKYFASARIGETKCKVLQVKYDEKDERLRYQLARLYIDAETNLPIRVQNYEFAPEPGGEPVLVEDYYYSKLKTNVGLKDIDFDTENPAYGF